MGVGSREMGGGGRITGPGFAKSGAVGQTVMGAGKTV